MAGGWNNSLLEAALQNAGVGLMVQDRNRRIVAINPTFEEITGWRWKDIRGKGCDEVFRCHTASGKSIVDELCPGVQVINEEQPTVTRELVINRGDGSECWVEVKVFPINDLRGEIEYIVSTFQDVSEKKKYSEELLRIKTLATMGQLAAELAHEVKNPLNAIQIQLLCMEQEIATHKEFTQGHIPEVVSRVKEEVTRLNGLVDNCLKFSRSSNLVIKGEPLGPILEELVELVAAQARLSGINIMLKVEGGLPHVMADREKLKQAILNVVLNAFEAMPDGGTLSLLAARDGDMVKVISRDTGHGIPEDVRENIFKLFYTTKRDGTGIGLPLAQNIVQAHGGSISCTSSDKGTEFVIELPLERFKTR
ncbi:MAG: nitrogen regulation protein NR(II) [Candidatus Brocadiales bacterium]